MHPTEGCYLYPVGEENAHRESNAYQDYHVLMLAKHGRLVNRLHAQEVEEGEEVVDRVMKRGG